MRIWMNVDKKRDLRMRCRGHTEDVVNEVMNRIRIVMRCVVVYYRKSVVSEARSKD